LGWDVARVEASNDVDALCAALAEARNDTQRPSLIAVRTHIGYGSPHKADTAAAHGSPLGVAEVRLTKEALGWPVGPDFLIPPDALDHFRTAVARGRNWQADWETAFTAYAQAFPHLAEEFTRVTERRLPSGWDADLPRFTTSDGPLATRVASGKALNVLAARLPELMGGSADLAPSTHTHMAGAGDFEPGQPAGRNMHFGIREHAMGAILNGMALHRGLIPFGATFLVFSDYMRPPMRLAAMNGLPAIVLFTHDSIAMGEDGPTHQPVEQLLGLRSLPGMIVLRPADANETVAAWRIAIAQRAKPVTLVLTRQDLPVLDIQTYPRLTAGVARGGYVLADAPSDAGLDIVLVATGSEVHLALESQTILMHGGTRASVVSLPSTELFAEQPQAYRDAVLPPGVPLLVIEAGLSLGWRSYVGPQVDVIGVDCFGASAPGPVMMEHYGFTVENVCRRAQAIVERAAVQC
jgi:transketolase